MSTEDTSFDENFGFKLVVNKIGFVVAISGFAVVVVTTGFNVVCAVVALVVCVVGCGCGVVFVVEVTDEVGLIVVAARKNKSFVNLLPTADKSMNPDVDFEVVVPLVVVRMVGAEVDGRALENLVEGLFTGTWLRTSDKSTKPGADLVVLEIVTGLELVVVAASCVLGPTAMAPLRISSTITDRSMKPESIGSDVGREGEPCDD